MTRLPTTPPTNTTLRFRQRVIERVWAQPEPVSGWRVWPLEGDGRSVVMTDAEFLERYEVDDTGLGTHLNQITNGSDSPGSNGSNGSR